MLNVHTIVTDRVLAALATGVVPWRKPWNGVANVPTNFVSKKPYRGVNRILLDPIIGGFTSSYWMTYKQATALGGNVRKDSKSSLATFWKFLDDRKNPGKKIPFLRYYNVFNLDQIEGIDVPTPPDCTIRTVDRADAIVAGYPTPPRIEHNGGDRCMYRPATDSIHMAARATFDTPEHYYATLFHELVHSTGHESRLDRLGQGREAYAFEELVAELGSAFLCSEAGIDNTLGIDQTAAYIAGWVKAIRQDDRVISRAASAAEKAVDCIFGKTWNNKTTDDDE